MMSFTTIEKAKDTSTLPINELTNSFLVHEQK